MIRHVVESVTANRVTLGGGQIVVGTYNGGLTYETSLTMKDGLHLVNTASGPYRAISVAQSTAANSPGACFRLTGGVSFTGNETNANRVELYNEPPSGDGVLSHLYLNGSQDFTIGDGAADVDLYTNFILADSTATGSEAGAVVKKGAGTLMLASGGTYTGGTKVEAGRLIVDGTLASGVTVSAGATFRGGAAEESGALAVAGDVTLASGAKLEVEPGATMTVSGTLALAGTEMTLKPGAVIEEECLVARATAITGAPTSNLGKFKAKVRNGGTELWIGRDNSFVVFVR